MPDLHRTKRQTVRLACPCGRNLADVRLSSGRPPGPVYTDPPPGAEPVEIEGPWPEYVWPVPRPGVRQREHQHGGVITFTWACRCGRSHQARRDRLTAAWYERAKIGRTVRLTLGTADV